MWTVVILTLCVIMLIVGRYNLLDQLIKIIIIVLTISTLVSVTMALFKTDIPLSYVQIFPKEAIDIGFLIAFMGWMPAPLDISVWHSLWAVEKNNNDNKYNLKTGLFDFNIGYFATIFLGLCFVFLGYLVMFNQNETFNETHLENSKLKRHGVGKLLDTLASLKDRKFISMNENGSFTITELAKEILWSSKIPIWAKILRLLQIKSCDLQQIIETINSSEDEIFNELEQLRKNQFVLMSPQRQDEKLIKVYEILPEGIEVIDKTETQGFENINFGKNKSDGEIIGTIEEILDHVKKLNCSDDEKNNITRKLELLKNKLEI